MRLTLHTDYAVRVLIYLALNQDKLVTITDISDKYSISKNHLMKVAQELVHHGLVISERGRNGGLRLSRQPEEINLRHVVEKMEPDFTLVACLDPSRNNCKIIGACGAQPIVMEAREAFLEVLQKYTLQDSLSKRDQLLSIFSLDSEPAS